MDRPGGRIDSFPEVLSCFVPLSEYFARWIRIYTDTRAMVIFAMTFRWRPDPMNCICISLKQGYRILLVQSRAGKGSDCFESPPMERCSWISLTLWPMPTALTPRMSESSETFHLQKMV